MIVEVLYAEEYDAERMTVAANITKDGVTQKFAYVIPKEAMEWRIAEYDLDPEDTDTLLDFFLFEPHVEVPQAEQLYETDTKDQAREAILSRIKAKRQESDAEKVKSRGAARTAGVDPEVTARGQMLGLFHRDSEVIAVKRQIIGHQLEKAQASRRRPDPPTSGRASDYKKMLEEMKNAANADA